MDLGRIASLELNHKPVDQAKKGDSVAMKIEATNTTESSRAYGRHFDHKVWGVGCWGGMVLEGVCTTCCVEWEI